MRVLLILATVSGKRYALFIVNMAFRDLRLRRRPLATTVGSRTDHRARDDSREGVAVSGAVRRTAGYRNDYRTATGRNDRLKTSNTSSSV